MRLVPCAHLGVILRSCLALLFLLSGTNLPAIAAEGKRVALVIGNGQYQSVGRLTNPPNDAARLAESFRRIGFDEVRVATDAGYAGLRQALAEFSDLARDAEIALVFYAGHGIEVSGQNYLIPVDAKLSHAKDVEFETVSLHQVQSTVEDAKGIGIVILDACRNNPFINRMLDASGPRAISRGLSRPVTRGNTLIVYSARDGTTASDGAGANSPFTTAFLKSIETPNLKIGLLFRQVRDDVIAVTGPDDPQEPFTYGSLSAKPIYLRRPQSEDVKAAEAPATAGRINQPLALEPSLDEYRTLFRRAVLRPEWDHQVEGVRRVLTDGKPRYQAVSQATGVPWFVIGILHYMESATNFRAHLHNGDPLTARTVHVPVGFPKNGGPPFTWEVSAIDALRLQRWDQLRIWTVQDTLSVFERYNGLSMRKRGIPTQFLWSGSNHYEKGKYLADGAFDPNSVSQQLGAAVLLKYAIPIQDIERTLNYREN